MKIDGSCHCGKIRYEAEIDPAVYSSPVTEDFPAYSLRLGIIRQRAQLRPKVECFSRSALDWNPGLAGTKRFDAMPAY